MDGGRTNTPIPMVWEVRLHGVYASMGDAERRVADYFRAQGFAILTRSIAEISEATGTSEATIVRFCRHVGYGGLKDFKIALAMEQSVPISEGEATLQWGDDIKAVRNKVFTDAIKALSDSMTLLDDRALARAVQALYEAKHIDIFGLGGSVAIAEYMHHQFMKIGVRTYVYMNAESQRLSLTQLDEGDVVLAISSSGETPEIVSAIRWAHTQRATVIALTNRPESTLASLSDIVLTTTGGPFLFGSQNTLSRFAQLAVVNTLYLGVALEMGESAVRALQVKKEAVQGLSAEE